MREGLTAIHNLAELLRSRRVAARALATAVQDVRDGAGHILMALGDLERAALEPFVAEPSFATMIAALFADTRARATDLSSVFDRFTTKSFGATRRLALEHALRPIAASVETALVVVDVLEALRAPVPTTLDLAQLLRERWSQPRRSESVLPVRLDKARTIPCVGDARILGPMVELAAGLVALRQNEQLTVSADEGGKTASVLRIGIVRVTRGASSPPRAEARLGMPRYEGREEIIRALAERAGCSLTLATDQRSAMLHL